MDHLIQNGLSNLEIETQHPHSSSSSSSSSQKEEEVKRNWLELPPDVTTLIFLKLGTIDILAIAQWVCTSWWKLSKQPHLFRSIHVERVLTLFGRSVHGYFTCTLLGRILAREAIDRSGGQLVEFSVRGIATDGLLHYMSEKSSSLRCLRLVNGGIYVMDDGLIQIAKKLPKLLELQIIGCSFFSKVVFETFGRFCPQLILCWITDLYPSDFQFYGVALAIAENMPELRHLNLFGTTLTADDLRAILDGCPHLESLDLRRCFYLEFRGDLKERCGNIKALRLPDDPTDDFEYEVYDHNDTDNPNYGISSYDIW